MDFPADTCRAIGIANLGRGTPGQAWGAPRHPAAPPTVSGRWVFPGSGEVGHQPLITLEELSSVLPVSPLFSNK